MTNNQQLAAHCRDVIANPQDHLDWVVDMARVALAALTQPASPVLKLPDSITELPCDVRLPNVTYRKGIHTRMLLEGLQRRAEYPREDDEPHTAQIEPLCATGGAEWVKEAEHLAEIYGTSFVMFRHGEKPQCADPTKVIITFTDKGLGYEPAPPEEK
ncbi:hypothetical protein [Pantoea sp. GM01]|uniref:hypothetical protein n=1 Tax=Pantoea sp. GM01 TaxID=1144320 RepID=UPI000270FFEA|nr:hypothetical protein [Pantoea sp. GM01]EJL90255.1 hypothetical protein PMI17_01775 [Pantoea sp. GM01]